MYLLTVPAGISLGFQEAASRYVLGKDFQCERNEPQSLKL